MEMPMITIEILQRLEDRIDNAVETIELLRLQLEDAENKREKLIAENLALQNKNASWEKNLITMLEKLDAIEVLEQSPQEATTAPVNHILLQTETV
jgi:cell division protein ZapB